jgi:hypothetical protein
MNTREYKKNLIALRNRAMDMSVDGLQESIKAEFAEPKWPAVLFDAMNAALERKMGKRAYGEWFDSLTAKLNGDV